MLKYFDAQHRQEFTDAVKAEPTWSLLGYTVCLAFNLAGLAHGLVWLFHRVSEGRS